ncbi:MAG: hypothetical protein PHW95_01200 [Patescibacteria group bacterium]|nr:hypothetical protein [Patescibacteria group bacterium]
MVFDHRVYLLDHTLFDVAASGTTHASLVDVNNDLEQIARSLREAIAAGKTTLLVAVDSSTFRLLVLNRIVTAEEVERATPGKRGNQETLTCDDLNFPHVGALTVIIGAGDTVWHEGSSGEPKRYLFLS